MPYNNSIDPNATVSAGIEFSCKLTNGIRNAGYIMIVVCMLLLIPMMYITIIVK